MNFTRNADAPLLREVAAHRAFKNHPTIQESLKWIADAIEPSVYVKDSSLREVGIAHAKSILEMVAALDCDYERRAELQAERDVTDEETWRSLYAADDLAALDAVGGECTSRDEAEERIREDALSVQVRSTEWYSYGATPPAPNEFEILIATGGPAARLIGELDDGTPITAKLQTQDWGTLWTDYDSTEEEDEAFYVYASVFYFGES